MTSALLAFLFAFKPFFFDAALSQPEPVVRASVVIETSTLREAGAGPAIASRVKRSATAALRAAAIGDDGGPADPVLAVTVRPARRPGDRLHVDDRGPQGRPPAEPLAPALLAVHRG